MNGKHTVHVLLSIYLNVFRIKVVRLDRLYCLNCLPNPLHCLCKVHTYSFHSALNFSHENGKRSLRCLMSSIYFMGQLGRLFHWCYKYESNFKLLEIQNRLLQFDWVFAWENYFNRFFYDITYQHSTFNSNKLEVKENKQKGFDCKLVDICSSYRSTNTEIVHQLREK